MSRRRHEPDDSLELLLDPICNMFGTIMFVALIAALLVLTKSGVAVDEAVSAAERRIESKSRQLEERADELERMLGALPAGEERELDAAAADRMERALGEIARRQELIDRYSTSVRETRSNIATAGMQIEPMREELARIREAVGAARSSKDRQVRTPIEREVGLFEYTIILWQDRLYAVCDLSNRPRDACEWLRTWNGRHVLDSRCSTPVFECSRVSIHISRSIVLREGAGIPCSDVQALQADAAFAALIASLDPAEDMIGFVVAPDSFDSFAAVKQAFLSAGFTYRVEPCDQRLPSYVDSWIPGHPRGL